MGDYDFTINPYSGCGFACSYCYAAAFSRSQAERETWGQWTKVKQNALELMRRATPKVRGARIYMSSVTDPYQPVERFALLTRGLLELMVNEQPRLTIQTRSPLVLRDLDVLRRFETVRVNLTVTTDSEEVRRVFEPGCPSGQQRLAAAKELACAGIDVGVTMTPLLPVANCADFAEQVRATGAQRFVVQDFHARDGDFVAGTREAARALMKSLGWGHEGYRAVVAELRKRIPHLVEGRDGFAPG